MTRIRRMRISCCGESNVVRAAKPVNSLKTLARVSLFHNCQSYAACGKLKKIKYAWKERVLYDRS